MTSTVDAVAIEVEAGMPVVLQRVPPGTEAAAVARAWGATLLDGPPWQDTHAGPRVVDLRHDPTAVERDAWDQHREQLGSADRPLVVLLDARSARYLLRLAPHVASWAGGVRLPRERTVRPARSEQELEAGREAMNRMVAENPDVFDALEGRMVGVDLASGALYLGRADAGPLDVAREDLDEGVVFLVRVRGER